MRREACDAVLVGIQMSDLDGEEATRQIRKCPRPKKNTIPITAMTANAMADAREQYLAPGMNDYVSKSVQPEMLLAKLAHIAISASVPQPSAKTMDESNKPTKLPDGDTQPANGPLLEVARLAGLETLLPPQQLREFIV